MASLPPIRRLLLEDFKTQRNWISPLLLTMNTFMESVVTSMTNGLDFASNTTSDIKTITLASVPTWTSPISITWSKKSRPIGVVVMNVSQGAGVQFTQTAAVQVQWQMNNQSLQITGVVGITPTSQQPYTLTLLCIAG